jgi:glycosyltransferase involved in cell wall biosynthesis
VDRFRFTKDILPLSTFSTSSDLRPRHFEKKGDRDRPTEEGTTLAPIEETSRSYSDRAGEKGINESPSVSIIIPCRNEEVFISRCLASIVANDYPKPRLEVLVVDGMSEDGTRQIIEEYVEAHPYIRMLENPRGIIPAALNVGIAEAKGDIVMRMDAHAIYASDYIRKCVKALDEYQASNVGGVWKIVPRGTTLLGECICSALSHPLGAGNAHFRLVSHRKEPIWVDTVPFFCCRKEIFQEIGVFNEALVYSEDFEFSLRVRKAREASSPRSPQVRIFQDEHGDARPHESEPGGKKVGSGNLLVPDIVTQYYARSDFSSFCRHNWRNGVWAILPTLYSPYLPVSWRHIIPLGFVTVILGLVVAALVWERSLWVLGLVLGMYLLACLGAAIQIAWRKRNAMYVLAMPLVFAALHFGYGLGSLWGLASVVWRPQFWKKLF